MLEAKHANGGLSSDETKAREVATLRLYGAGASPKKFARIDAQQVGGMHSRSVSFRRRRADRPRLGQGHADAEPEPRRPRRGWRAEAELVDMIADGCSYADACGGGARRRAGGAQARSARTAGPRRPAGEALRLVRLVGNRGANHAVARRFARRREGPRYFPRQRSPTRRGQTSTPSPPPTSCTKIRVR